MASSSAKPVNKNKPYSQKDIDLILSLVPNKTNLSNLAAALGRGTGAIGMIYEIAYSGKLLKQNLDDNDPGDDVFDKIARAKKKLGIFIGFEP